MSCVTVWQRLIVMSTGIKHTLSDLIQAPPLATMYAQARQQENISLDNVRVGACPVVSTNVHACTSTCGKHLHCHVEGAAPDAGETASEHQH